MEQQPCKYRFGASFLVVLQTSVVVCFLMTVVTTLFRNPHVPKVLLLCNDVETNPGPLSPGKRRGAGPQRRGRPSRTSVSRPGPAPPVLNNEEDVDVEPEQVGEDGRKLSRRPFERLSGKTGSSLGPPRDDRTKVLETKHEALEGKIGIVHEKLDYTVNALNQVESAVGVMEQLMTRVQQMDTLLNDDEAGLVRENQKLKIEAVELKKTLVAYEVRFNEMDAEVQGIKSQMNELVCVYDDLQDRLYEIDRSWQNNLVFYGIKPDPGGVHESIDCLEHKIKGVLRNSLNIGRDIPIVRLQRIFNGSDVRGYKPVIVNFQKWSDKEDVLRKAKILKTSGIFVEEDYSRAAKFRRRELEKLAKEVKNLSPEKKCIFKHDKLIIDDHVYVYNDQEHRIERLPYSVSASSGLDEEVGDAATISRRLRQRQVQAPQQASSKRAQSVESVLDRIPPVQTAHNTVNGHHMTGSISSNGINLSNGASSIGSLDKASRGRDHADDEDDNDESRGHDEDIEDN